MLYKIITVFILTMGLLNAQNKIMNYTLKELETKNKLELVQIAMSLLKEKYPSISVAITAYKISVFKNSQEIFVELKRLVKFIPKRDESKQIAYDLKINLIAKTCIPLDNPFFGSLYEPSNYDLTTITFVNKYFGNFSPEFIHTITETEKGYRIERSNAFSYGIYTLIKATGEVKEPLETSYLPTLEPNLPEKETLIEIVE